MSQTRAQRKKQQKVLSRKKALQKQHNIQMNAPAKRFRLDVFLDGAWRVGIREWAKAYQYEAHRADTEARREKGEEIAPGRVVDLVAGKVVLEIEGSKPKGAAPDKIADGPKASDVESSVQAVELPVEKPVESAGQVESLVESPVETPNSTVEAPAEEPKKKRSKFFRILKGEL